MDEVKVIYVRSLSVGGLLLRAAQWWSQWTHCGLITPYGTVINARAFRGVVEEPLDTFLSRYSKHDIVSVAVPNAASVYRWARAQLGCGYDYGALVNMVSSKFGVHESPSRWECVELVESAIYAGGTRRFRTPLSRVTVAQSYMVK